MKKMLLKNKILFAAVFLTFCCFGFAACTWFESPEGEAEVVSVHTAEDDVYRYCFAEVKITNTGKCDIYTSNISVQASSNKSTYYKSASLATTIEPKRSIYITMDFTIPLEKEEKQTVTTTSSSSTTGTSGTTNSTNSSETTTSSNTSGSSTSSSSSGNSSSSGSSDSTSNSTSTTTTTSTSTTTTTSVSNNVDKETWRTGSVRIVENFFD